MQGGEGTYAYELSLALKELGHDVFILCGLHKGMERECISVDRDIKKRGIKIKRYYWVKKDKFWFLNWQEIFKNYYIENGNFDAVLFANFSALVVGHRLDQKLLKKINYSITFHGDDIFYFFSKKKLLKSLVLINYFKKNFFFKNAKKNIFVSDHALEMFKFYSNLKLDYKIIHHGIHKKNILIKKRKKKRKFIFVYPSRIEKMKGQEEWIKSVLRNDFLQNNIETIFIGTGPEYNKVLQLVKNNNAEKYFKFLGQIPREKVLSYLKLSDAVISLSNHPSETFGIIILEGMMLKKPLVLYNRKVLKKIVNDKEALIVNNSNLNKKLFKFINDRNFREKIAKFGHVKYLRKFTGKIMAEKTLKAILD